MLSHRYITDRFLPDKAIDLVDEAAAKLRMEIDSMPAELDEVERRIMQLEIEREALRKENGQGVARAAAEAREGARRPQGGERAAAAHWQQEKEAIAARAAEGGARAGAPRDRARPARGRLRQGVRAAVRQAPGARDASSSEAEARLAERQGRACSRKKVDEEDIAEVVSRWTGIPVSRLMEGRDPEAAQDGGAPAPARRRPGRGDRAVANAIRRARAGLQDPNRPLGSFIFLGPTGVGKTELARALAEFLFDDEQAMIRIDMSEYQEKHTVSRLIGAPPGYVGYEEGGQLTEAVRRAVLGVLFDEIEKAHPDVLNVLLQMLDDGRLTDGKGRTVDFKNTDRHHDVEHRQPVHRRGAGAARRRRRRRACGRQVIDALRQHFRPEFLNRVDEIIVFHPLSREQIEAIVDIQLARLMKRLEERKIRVELTDAAKDFWSRKATTRCTARGRSSGRSSGGARSAGACACSKGEFREGDTCRRRRGDELSSTKSR